MSLRLRLASVSAKILIAFLAILAMFGGVTTYGAWTMRRLSRELRRIASGYLALRLQVQDIQTHQDNLRGLIERTTRDPGQEPTGPPSFVKGAVDNARSFRRAELRRVRDLVKKLADEASEPTAAEIVFLHEVDERLRTLERTMAEDEDLFDRLYGPVGAKRIAFAPERDETARPRLVRQEEKVLRDLVELSKALRDRVQAAEAQLRRDEQRAVYATVLLAASAALLGLGVMALAQRALAPLRRLASGAQQLARGDYRHRVDATAKDEIGVLAGEFNAMAAALEERELRLIRSERLAAIGKIAAQITHEVRNPLSSIGLNAELILEEVEQQPGEARDLVRAIIQEVDRLTEITEHYLRLTRRPRPKLEREDMNALVSSLLLFVREDLAKRGITVEAQLDDLLPPALVDEAQLRQALLNLIRNAAEAMQGGGRLNVTTGRSPDPERPVEVVIRDTGEGIPEEVRAKIFDPFFSTKAGGTGLGLALTQQIIVEHGGLIDLDSAPGRGTCFALRLPAASGELQPTSVSAIALE